MIHLAQIPDPSLIKDVGVVEYLFIVVVLSGVATIAWFLRDMSASMKKLASNQEPTLVLLTKVVEKLDHLDGKVDEAIELAREHVQYGRQWANSEAIGRVIKDPGSQGERRG